MGDTLLELRRQFGLSIVMIEHHVPLVVRVCDYVYCLDFGQLLTDGSPQEVRNHPQVVAAYLGEDPDPVAVALEAQLDRWWRRPDGPARGRRPARRATASRC